MTVRGWRRLGVVLMVGSVCCATAPPGIVEKMQAYNGMVTTASADCKTPASMPMKEIPLHTNLYTMTWIRWDLSVTDAGKHDVAWEFYLNDKLYTVRKDQVPFSVNPGRIHWCQATDNFEVGHYRVDVKIDSRVVDKLDFDVVPQPDRRPMPAPNANPASLMSLLLPSMGS